jgi:AcrR family transcriptional regulator
MTNDARNEKRSITRQQVRDAVLREFAIHGFEETSVEKVAHAAGISRRTFFRYFQTKEDVVVTGLHESGQFLVRLIEDRPVDEHPVVTLQQALEAFLTYYQQNRARSWAILQMIQSHAGLRARFLVHRDQWRAQVAELLHRRGVDQHAADLLASNALAVLTVVYDQWYDDQDLDLQAAIDDGFATLRRFYHQAPE